VFEVVTETPEATVVAALGALLPLTPLSVHDGVALAVETLIVPEATTVFRYSRKVALVTLDALTPAGKLVRSKNSSPFEEVAPPTAINGEEPKLVLLLGMIEASAVSGAVSAQALVENTAEPKMSATAAAAVLICFDNVSLFKFMFSAITGCQI